MATSLLPPGEDPENPDEIEEKSAPRLAPGLLLRPPPGQDAFADDFHLPLEDLPVDDGDRRRTGWRRLLHPFALLVGLPTLAAVGFEYLVAADQYESSAQFTVRAPQQDAPIGGIGQMLGLNQTPVATDAHSVDAYLLSHDAIAALGTGRLTAIFRRPEADIVTRLWPSAPTPETLLKYYQRKVHVTTASETGITMLTARGYRPSDAKVLADDLLRLGEARVNQLNQRMFDEGLASSRRQLREAEADVERTQRQLTQFRQVQRDADPERTSGAQIQLAASLQQQAAQTRAEFQAMEGGIPHSAPQYRAFARHVAALDRQVAAAKAGLAGSESSLAAGLGGYEELQMHQQLVAKRYEAAQTSYQTAREQLLKQQLFIIPVVEPNLPVKATYPKRLTDIAIVFFGLVFAYAIGWLILAGLREHAE